MRVGIEYATGRGEQHWLDVTAQPEIQQMSYEAPQPGQPGRSTVHVAWELDGLRTVNAEWHQMLMELVAGEDWLLLRAGVRPTPCGGLAWRGQVTETGVNAMLLTVTAVQEVHLVEGDGSAGAPWNVVSALDGVGSPDARYVGQGVQGAAARLGVVNG